MHVVLPLALSFAVVLLDQGTKRFFEIVLSDSGEAIPVTPFFNLVLGHNRGISFGLLSSEHPYAPYLLAGFAVAAVVGFIVWMWHSDSIMQRFGLAAVIGGAIGNAVDRLKDGGVTDFLDFYVGAYHWPTFNLADAAIACGVAALLVESVWPRSNVTPGSESGLAHVCRQRDEKKPKQTPGMPLTAEPNDKRREWP